MLFEIESSRLIFAFFTGLFLSLSGSLSQTVTHNPLASPSTLGFDGLAVLCLIFSYLLLSFIDLSLSYEILSFIIFNLLFFFIYYLSSKFQKNRSHYALDMKAIIIMGLSFNLLIGAIFSFIQFLFIALNENFPSAIWFGSFKNYNEKNIIIFILVFIVSILSLKISLRSLRFLSIGTQFSKGLKIPIIETQKKSLFLSFYLTGLVICFFGVFSFIALVFPHLLRQIKFIGNDIKKELTYGALISALIMMTLDFLCYNLTFYGAELPVGMISSILGSLILIILLIRNHYKTLQFSE